MRTVDLRSDTFTKPTEGMLQAMQSAEVGDDVWNEDPTVQKLEQELAEIFGKEAGLFCPSGTMSNQIAIKIHTRPGEEVICHRESHIYQYEAGGIAFNSLCSVHLIEGNRGMIKPEQLQSAVNPLDVHKPKSTLVSLEDTSNRGGGAVYSVQDLLEIGIFCKANDLKLHLDGARVFNALAVNGLLPAEYAKPFDTLSICLSKGLGCPVGSVLIGSQKELQDAKRVRKVLGGGMRQVGYLAAAGRYAIQNHVSLLQHDHRRARRLASVLMETPWVDNVLPPDTNILVFKLKNSLNAHQTCQKLAEKGVLGIPFGEGLVRFVTHLDISDNDIDYVESVLRSEVL